MSRQRNRIQVFFTTGLSFALGYGKGMAETLVTEFRRCITIPNLFWQIPVEPVAHPESSHPAHNSSEGDSTEHGSRPSLHFSQRHHTMNPARQHGQWIKFQVNDAALMAEMERSRVRLAEDSSASGFVLMFETETERAIDYCLGRQRSNELYAADLLLIAANTSKCVDGGDRTMEGLCGRADNLSSCCLQLEQLVVTITNTLKTIATQADSRLGTACMSNLEMELSSFKDHPGSASIVIALSDIYNAIRERKEDRQTQGEVPVTKEDIQWKAPSSFVRSTTKYWVADDKLTEVMLGAVTEAPLLVYGKSGRLTDKENGADILPGDPLWEGPMSTPISSVYFDSEDHVLYRKRLARGEGAQLLRARWYGKQPRGTDPVFLELKTHHEQWVNSPSKKERVTIQEKHMERFLSTDKNFTAKDAEDILRAASPFQTAGELEKAVSLFFTMRSLVVQRGLRPRVRSTYMRVAFQSPESNSLRLTLDRFVSSTDESKAPPGSWCLPEEESTISAASVKRMPVAIFEVKLAGREAPAALQELIASGAIVEAAKFSKFLTGVAAFNADKLDILPYWANHASFGPMFGLEKPRHPPPLPEHPSLPTQSVPAESTASADTTSSTSGSSSSPSELTGTAIAETHQVGVGVFRRLRAKANALKGQKKTVVAPKKPARVEPKSYFANERTFIQWISAALLLVTISVLLLDFQTELSYAQNAAKTLGCFAVFIVVYSLFVYYRRIQKLSSGQSYGYVDHFGPLLLAVAILAGVTVLLFHIFSESSSILADAAERLAFLREEKDLCFKHSSLGLSPLNFEPSDALVDAKKSVLLVASKTEIFGFPLPNVGADGHISTADTPPKRLIDIPGADLEALTRFGDTIFAVDEEDTGASHPTSTLYVLNWSEDGDLHIVGNWTVPVGGPEGAAFVPGKMVGGRGGFYLSDNSIVGNEKVTVFELRGDVDELKPHHSLNNRELSVGLKDASKIGAMTFFEGVLYIMYGNARVVRAWDLEAGVMLSEWKLPFVSGGAEMQWEGLALERIGSERRNRLGRSLQSSGDLLVHLTLDTPLEVWSFVAQEGNNPGSIVLPGCAAGLY